ncbi:hypothetical protein CPB85DRAFT_1558305 [Mucidula mucida]|nr:hypothetical protein CPB85DRAFT_1558305 [Mucidula mucida]
MLPTPCVAPYTWQQPDSSISSTDTLPVPQGDREPIPEHDTHRGGRRNLLGFGSRTSEAIPVEHGCDYETKYGPDEEYKEMGPNARIWLTYLDESRIFDTQKCEEWQDGLGVLIVFASLFTMVVSIFCSQSFKYLRPDTNLMISALITEMVQINRAIADGTPIENVPRADITTFTPMQPDVWVIGMWYTSHALSLSVAVFAMLAKQWIRHYMILPSGDARQRARTRHFRYMALQKWRVPEIIDFLPVLMHVAFTLFCVGLIVFLFTLHKGMAIVVTSVFAALFVVCSVMVLLPVFKPACPYKTPLAFHAFDALHFWRGKSSPKTNDPSIRTFSASTSTDVVQDKLDA